MVRLNSLVLICSLTFAAHAHAAPTCPALATSSRADPTTPSSIWAAAIWSSVLAAFERLEAGPSPRLAILGASPLEAGGWYCPSADTVYLSHALVDYAWLGRASDGADLLAFAIAHELAHRRFDTGHEAPTAGLAQGQCPLDDSPREARADRHATFLMAIADNPMTGRGYSPFSLDRRDALEAFFASELGWSSDCPALASRLASVSNAIADIATLSRMWDIALDLSAVPEAALAFIDAIASPSNAWESMPELDVLGALAHLERAGEVGWCPAELANSGLDPDPCTLRCTSLFRRQPRLSPRDDQGTRGGIDRSAELRAARARLTRAEHNGVPAAALEGVATCLAYLEADPARALALGERGPPPRTARQRAARLDNRRLFRLQRFLLEQTAPLRSDEWLDALREHRDLEGFDPTPTTTAIASWLAPSLRPSKALGPLPIVIPACTGASQRLVYGGATVDQSGPCTTIRGQAYGPSQTVSMGTRWTIHDVPLTTQTRDLFVWERACHLGSPGLGDDGTTVVRAQCAAMDDDSRWVLYVRDHVVERAARIEFTP